MYNENFFEKAYRLAETARGKTGSNPFVGAVIVKDGKIAGTGCTQACGCNHAEIEALIAAGEKARGSDLYVTLEPCCHQGRTPPCTDAVIKAGIKRVFIGMEDPNPLVCGKGIAALRKAGIEVTSGIEKEKIAKQLEVYVTNQLKNRPFFAMKNAVSLDGKIAVDTGASKWITSPAAREYVHRLRKELQVILTGVNTVIKDDPLLNIRLNDRDSIDCGIRLRVILDSKLRIPVDSRIVNTAASIPTLIFKENSYNNRDKENQLTSKNVQILSVPENKEGGLSLTAVSDELKKHDINSVLIEAGTVLNSSFLRYGLLDKIYYFIAPKILGGSRSVFKNLDIKTPAEALPVEIDRISHVGGDILVIGYPRYGKTEVTYQSNS